jgi:hypothetical protein
LADLPDGLPRPRAFSATATQVFVLWFQTRRWMVFMISLWQLIFGTAHRFMRIGGPLRRFVKFASCCTSKSFLDFYDEDAN